MHDNTYPIDLDCTAATPMEQVTVYRELPDETDVPLLGPALGALQSGVTLEHLAKTWADAGEHPALVGTLNHVAGALQILVEHGSRVDRRVSDALTRCERSYRYQGESLLRFEERVARELAERFREQDARAAALAEQGEHALDQAQRMHARTVRAQASQGARLRVLEERVARQEALTRGWQLVSAVLLGAVVVAVALLSP